VSDDQYRRDIIDVEPQRVHNCPRVVTRVFDTKSTQWPQEIGGRSCWASASGVSMGETHNISLSIMPEGTSDGFDIVMGHQAAEEIVRLLQGLIYAQREHAKEDNNDTQ